MTAVFSCDPAALESISITGDVISLNGISKTKNDLSMEIVRQLSPTTPMHPEVETRLLAGLTKAIA